MPSVFLAGPSRAAPFFLLPLRGRQFVFFSGDVCKPALFFSGDRPAFYFCGDGHCSSRHSNDGTAGVLAVSVFVPQLLSRVSFWQAAVQRLGVGQDGAGGVAAPPLPDVHLTSEARGPVDEDVHLNGVHAVRLPGWTIKGCSFLLSFFLRGRQFVFLFRRCL